MVARHCGWVVLAFEDFGSSAEGVDVYDEHWIASGGGSSVMSEKKHKSVELAEKN